MSHSGAKPQQMTANKSQNSPSPPNTLIGYLTNAGKH